MESITSVLDRTDRITVSQPVQVTIVKPDFTDRVHRGACLLDDLFGTDWRGEVKLDELDLISPTQCVLGQVFVESIVNGATRNGEHYGGGVEYLFPRGAYAHMEDPYYVLRDRAASHHGFLVSEEDLEAWNSYAEDLDPNVERAGGTTAGWLYEVLTAAWVNYLRPFQPEQDEQDEQGDDESPNCWCGEYHENGLID